MAILTSARQDYDRDDDDDNDDEEVVMVAMVPSSDWMPPYSMYMQCYRLKLLLLMSLHVQAAAAPLLGPALLHTMHVSLLLHAVPSCRRFCCSLLRRRDVLLAFQ
jgi:hypothetical protein